MIQSIIEFNDKEAGEILTPRVDIIGIEASASLDDVMDLIDADIDTILSKFKLENYNPKPFIPFKVAV